MRHLFFPAVAIFLFSCGGDLTKQQRERIKESVEEGQIQRVTPAQLTDAAFQNGRAAAALFADDPNLGNSKKLDSLKQSGIRVFLMRPGKPVSPQIAAQVLEAYVAAGDASNLSDNVQKAGTDTLLYTAPISFERPDGSQVFNHALGVAFPVKFLVKSIEE